MPLPPTVGELGNLLDKHGFGSRENSPTCWFEIYLSHEDFRQREELRELRDLMRENHPGPPIGDIITYHVGKFECLIAFYHAGKLEAQDHYRLYNAVSEFGGRLGNLLSYHGL